MTVYHTRKKKRRKARAEIYSWRKIKYDRMKTASYMLNLPTIIELFHPIDGNLLYFVNRNS